MNDRMLEWYVYIEDINLRIITTYNIFDHCGFMNDLRKIAKQPFAENRIQFAAHVTNALRYYFWGKTEWEIVLSSWPPDKKDKPKKISVFDQVMLNLEQFNKYLFDHKSLLTIDNNIPMDDLWKQAVKEVIGEKENDS